MGVLYDVLFKPIGRGDGGSTTVVQAATATAVNADGRAAVRPADADQAPPEWVLVERDGGPLVWRRYGPSPSHGGRKRVEFLDAVQVRVFERDDNALQSSDYGGGGDDDDSFTGDWSWHVDDDDSCKSLLHEAWADKDDYPVLVAVSVTVLGLCIGLAYLFAPIKWLLHHILVDD